MSMEEAESERPLCSVLSTVINHVMVPPSPMEPEEFQANNRDKTKPVRVPVLRVFGPIIRGDAPSGKDPVQSACLYIHGAFPYMLARPVTAGPDGSLHHSSHLFRSASNQEPSLTSSGHVDWDNPEVVRLIAGAIEQNLEATLQASVVSFDQKDKGSTAPSTTNETSPKFIRSITVVMGRGFYTYCPGPSAPFLRVEYYDPKLRWKVKMMLEKGLDLPQYCHPDPQQYDAVGLTPAADSSQLGLDPLSFHCYEAHLPFTMQFFKDWNLSGMAYIHLAQGKFRRDLPSYAVKRWNDHGKPIDAGNNSRGSARDLAFLRNNTDARLLWENGDPENDMQGDGEKTIVPEGCHNLSSSTSEETIGISDTVKGLQQVFSSSTAEEQEAATKGPLSNEKNKEKGKGGKGKPFWATKETSCDVEIDVVVSSILNIKSVMKDLPEDESEKQNCHWRAVPSLREIWHEERRRMAKLLEPQHDFLSRQPAAFTGAAAAAEKTKVKEEKKVTPPFTLSVKKNASTPGAMLAAKGMKRLLNVTDGLEQDFIRAARQIVQRYSDAIYRVDKVLQTTPTARVVPRHPVRPTGITSVNSVAPQLTPTIDDALDALGALASQFDQPPDEPNATRVLEVSDSNENPSSNLQSPCSSSQSQKEPLHPMSQSCDTLRRAIDEDSPLDQYELSQRIDRGDSILDGRFQNVEDFVDPQTLIPYDSLDEAAGDEEEDELDDAGMERVLTHLATQLVNCDNQNASLPSPPVDGTDVVPSSYAEHDDASSPSSLNIEDAVSSDESVVDTATDAPVTVSKTKARVDTGRTLKAPLRGSINRPQVRLNPRGSKNRREVPSWLSHSSVYEKIRTKNNAKSKLVPSLLKSKLYVQPVHPPPRRDEVKYWHQKQFPKRRRLDTQTLFGKRRNGKETGTTRDIASVAHGIDCNTGKTVPAGKKQAASQGTKSTRGEKGEVEEIHWVATQSQPLSATQEEGAEVTTRPKNQARSGRTAPSAIASLSLKRVAVDLATATPADGLTEATGQQQALQGMQNQGGKLVVEGGGQLKATTRPSESQALKKKKEKEGCDDRYLPSPLTMMCIEVHVQCRTGRAGISSANLIAMTPDPDRDHIFAIAYAYGRDPGGGATFDILERGCIYVPLEQENGTSCKDRMKASLPVEIFGVASTLSVETVQDEKLLLLRLASIVRTKDPDMLISWDTQGAGLGYIVERGANVDLETTNNNSMGGNSKLDMVKLLGRLPSSRGDSKSKGETKGFFSETTERRQDSGKEKAQRDQPAWAGSGLGADWDEKVGAGRAAASIIGRLVFAGWKIIAEEVKHPNYSSLCAMVSAVLSKRIPFHDDLNLTNWYACMNGRERWRVLHHRLAQCTATLQLFDALDIVGRAGEAARLSGVEFSHSFPGVRGSQYKVEGVLLRALQSLNSEERGSKLGEQKGGDFTMLSGGSKSQANSPWKTRRKLESTGAEAEASLSKVGYYFFSPSLRDTEKQEALEVQALTLEPQSGHQTDPVVVCDFTALYPSLMIAYNLCYSTCAGRLSYHTTRREMHREGQTTSRLGPFHYSENRTATVLKHHMKSTKASEKEPADIMSSKDRVYIAPTGTIFVSESVVRGVLPQVLDEMLSTRAMLKKAAKNYKKRVKGLSPSVLRQLEARQLALKYVANVTYGYTSATFSGRCAMPVLADTIVECGRRTLTNAINLANSWGKEPGGKWHGCEVLYGDTDSVFVRLPGRSVDEAFDFGEQFCKTVTAFNPPPVQLKLEKVYLGSILQTKKKYCGMKFESRDAKLPEFEAKGIETVRRDQCALAQKVLRNSLVMLFRHGINAVKDYLYRQWSLILAGRLPVSDFIITGRVRNKYRGGKIGPVQAALFRRLAEADPGRVMRTKERISYVIVATPGASYRLRDCVLTPMELLAQWDSYTLHSNYYIVKHVNAALQRCFGLAPHFIKINDWFEDCPKPRRRIHFWPVTRTGSSSMISAYFGSDICSLCGAKCMAQGRARAVVCSACRNDEVMVAVVASKKLQKAQEEAMTAARVCSACNSCFEDASTFAPERVDNTERSSSSSRRQEGVAVPIAACTCIDCPVTYKRHRLREESLEMEEICKALYIL